VKEPFLEAWKKVVKDYEKRGITIEDVSILYVKSNFFKDMPVHEKFGLPPVSWVDFVLNQTINRPTRDYHVVNMVMPEMFYPKTGRFKDTIGFNRGYYVEKVQLNWSSYKKGAKRVVPDGFAENDRLAQTLRHEISHALFAVAGFIHDQTHKGDYELGFDYLNPLFAAMNIPKVP
jgi:hypothetical protein